MIQFKYIFLSFLFLQFVASCTKDATPEVTVESDTNEFFDISIVTPESASKSLDSTMSIHVRFIEKEMFSMHYVNVRIYQQDDTSNVVYNEPDDIHVHAVNGEYNLYDQLTLSSTNGFEKNKNYTLEARTWGDFGGTELQTKMNFSVQ